MRRRDFLSSLMLGIAAPSSLAIADEPVSASSRAIPVSPPRSVDALVLRRTDGGTTSVSAFSGKFMVLNLWAPWCLPCRKEMPSLSRLHEKLKPLQAEVVPLAFDWRGAKGIEKFYAEAEISNLPAFVGDGTNLQTVTGLVGLPTTLIINRKGLHISTVIGAASWDDDETLVWLTSLAAA